jgi:Domain of unknown function (DUF4271)
MFTEWNSFTLGLSGPNWETMELSERVGNFGTFQLFFLLISLILIVLAKATNTQSYSVVFKLFFISRKAEARIKDSWSLLGSPAWFLALNFIITFAHSLYLFYSENQGESLFAVLLSLAIAFGFFILAFVAMALIAFLTGERIIYQTPMQTTWVLPQFVGIVFFLLNLIWVLNPEYSEYLKIGFLVFFFLLSIKRFVRSSLFLLKHKVEWYYILLYLCTLEILPLSILGWFLLEMDVIRMFN